VVWYDDLMALVLPEGSMKPLRFPGAVQAKGG